MIVYAMVGVAQLVERQIVVLNVAGSIPVTHPKRFEICTKLTSGRGAVGSALALGARGRQFESDRPDHIIVHSELACLEVRSTRGARSSVG